MNNFWLIPAAAIVIAANVWAIAPAVDKEYDSKQASVINHKFDNLDNQADLDEGYVYQASDGKAYKMVDGLASNEWQPTTEQGYTDEYLRSEQYKEVKAANESLRKIRGGL